MAAPQVKAVPKDAEVMVAILKDMGITEYEPRLVNQMLEFTYRYVTDVLEDAQAYSSHAGRTEIDSDDVKLAIQSRLDHSFTTPPPREFLMEIARQKNNNPLPAIKPHNGLRLPPDRYCLSGSNYRLKPLHKRATLTMPSRLSLGSGMSMASSAGSKLSPSFTFGGKSPYSVTVRAPVSSKAGGAPISIIKSVSRSSATPTITMQPGSTAQRAPSGSTSGAPLTVIKTQVVSPPPSQSSIVNPAKRKREEEEDD
ncbi:transcription initiation factor TFIID subunit 9-like [Acanthaster planci]|uniref:Transcription initiation factor TFIID subunit 9-like n=1 Tax=Acanthaster planci TaxID=133434 RepID=A0A8B7Y458_ACAPL|nr:transcription initiation factor TFIID subunit 9-like [Acanthaster planci]